MANLMNPTTIGGIDILDTLLNLEYRLGMAERIIDKILVKYGTEVLSTNDYVQIREDVLADMRRKYPQINITKKKILKVFPKTDCDGVIIEMEDKSKMVFSKTLIATLKNQVNLNEIEPSKLLIDESPHSCKNLPILTTYNDIGIYSKEDLKALSEMG